MKRLLLFLGFLPMRSIVKIFIFILFFGACQSGLHLKAEIKDIKQNKEEKELNKPKPLERPSAAEEKELSRYMYFLDSKSRRLMKLNVRDGGTEVVNIDVDIATSFNDLKYNSYTFPGSRGTGNQFFVLYYPKNKAFMVYDKITGKLDKTYQLHRKERFRIGNIYPVDYTEIGDNIYLIFFMVSRSPSGDTDKLESIYKNKSGKIVKRVLAPQILADYYNSYEKKLLWMEPSGPGTLKVVVYHVPEKNRREFRIRTPKNCLPRVMMQAYEFIGIRFKNQTSGKLQNYIFEIGNSEALLKFNNSSLFCHTVNKANLYILVSEKTVDENRLHFFQYNSRVSKVLERKEVPGKVIKFLSPGWDMVKRIFYLSCGSTYYVCVIIKTGNKYRYQLFRLTGSLKYIDEVYDLQTVPFKYYKDTGVEFFAERSLLLLKGPRSGVAAVGRINNDGRMQFYPE